MSPEERQMLTALFDRIKFAAGAPRDADAEALIAQSVRDQPYAPYLLAQAVLVQEQGMKAATDRIAQLEAQVKALEESASRAPQQPSQSGSGGFLGGLGSLFGGGQPASQPQRPSPQQQNYGQPQGYAPQQNYGQQQPGPWGGQQQQPSGPWSQQPQAQSAGGGFLRGALGTAAGVAGGVMLAEGISSLFSPHLGGVANAASLGGFANPAAAPEAAPAVEETVVNNYYGSDDNGQNDDSGNNGFDNASMDNNDDGFDSSYDDGNDDSYNV